MRRPLSLVLLVGLSACASEGMFDGTSTEQADDTGVDYRRPDAPIDLDFADGHARQQFSLAYGQCEEGPTQDGVDTQINCGNKWSELAWFRISPEDVGVLAEQGRSSLTLNLSIDSATFDHDSLRLSLHSVDADQNLTKLISEPILIDGDSVQAELAPGLEHYVFLARGDVPVFLWASGLIEFELELVAQ